jgi:hypothetical protein
VARKRKPERNEGGCVLLLDLCRLELQLKYASSVGKGKGKEDGRFSPCWLILYCIVNYGKIREK